MNKLKIVFLLFVVFVILMVVLTSSRNRYGDEVLQLKVDRIELMPDLPQPLKIIDWQKKAIEFDDFVFDLNSDFPTGPVIWLDDSRRNVNQMTYGIYTAINDVRQGPNAYGGEFHESLNSMAAVLGGGLMGIDKTNQHGFNFVSMLHNYFNTDNGWGIMMNNTNPEVAMLGGGYGRDWWYDLFPNVLYYSICDVFPNVSGSDTILRKIAEKCWAADSVLAGNYNYSYFDYARMKGMVNHIPHQQDAAGGHGYILLMAHRKFGDDYYLAGAKSAIQALDNQQESRFYEILLPLGVYAAAYLNATEGTHYDIHKMLAWVFEGCQSKDGRYGWGVIADKWGPYDVSGLQGSIKDGSGYGFLMNSIKLSWPLVPLVKYQPQYARAIGKWMLNNVNACRLFYPDQIEDQYQWLPEMKNLTNGVVAYEGLRKKDLYQKESLKGVSPVALGDGPKWHPNNPKESMFSIYSTAPVGIFGAMISKTNVEGILRIDCNSTDFYAKRDFPVYLYYNPYQGEKEIVYHTSAKIDLFDIVSKQYVAKNVTGKTTFRLQPNMAAILVELPTGMPVVKKNNKLYAGSSIIAYQ